MYLCCAYSINITHDDDDEVFYVSVLMKASELMLYINMKAYERVNS